MRSCFLFASLCSKLPKCFTYVYVMIMIATRKRRTFILSHEMKWFEMKLNELKWHELKWCEIKWNGEAHNLTWGWCSTAWTWERFKSFCTFQVVRFSRSLYMKPQKCLPLENTQSMEDRLVLLDPWFTDQKASHVNNHSLQKGHRNPMMIVLRSLLFGELNTRFYKTHLAKHSQFMPIPCPRKHCRVFLSELCSFKSWSQWPYAGFSVSWGVKQLSWETTLFS